MGVNEEFDMDSDHLPIALMLSETIIKTRTKFNPLEQTNWLELVQRKKLENRISLRVILKSNDEIE